MKRNILLLAFLTYFATGFAQPLMQASLGPGSQANRIKIYLKPAATQTPSTISTLQFNLGISTTITPKPTLTVVSTTFAGVTWGITQATQGGFYNYQLITATSPLQPNTVANTEFEVMEVQLSGGPIGLNNVALVTLADGGLGASNGNSLFLCTGTLASVGTNLYYTKTGVTVNNQNSYDASGATAGVATSTATIGNISLPVSWLDFSIQKNNNAALLKWKVEDHGSNSHFNVEVSANGSSFVNVATINANSSDTYTFTDIALASRTNGKYAYYRIKQTDKDGRFSYSKMAFVDLSDKIAIKIIPNPATDFINVSGSNLQTIMLYDNVGRLMQTVAANGAASTIVPIANLSKGMYQVKAIDTKGNIVMEQFLKQ